MKTLVQVKCEKCGEPYCREEGFGWWEICPACRPKPTLQMRINWSMRITPEFHSIQIPKERIP